MSNARSKHPPGAARALVFSYLKANATNGRVTTRAEPVAAATGVTLTSVRKVLLRLASDGTLIRRQTAHSGGRPAVYEIVGAAPRPPKRPEPSHKFTNRPRPLWTDAAIAVLRREHALGAPRRHIRLCVERETGIAVTAAQVDDGRDRYCDRDDRGPVWIKAAPPVSVSRFRTVPTLRRPEDNPVKRVPPGTHAARNFSMIGGSLR